MKANGMSKNLSRLEEMVEKHRGVPIHLNNISVSVRCQGIQHCNNISSKDLLSS